MNGKYFDKTKWAKVQVSRLKKWLSKDYVQDLINNGNFEEAYSDLDIFNRETWDIKYLGKPLAPMLTAIFLDSNIKFLESATSVPKECFSYLPLEHYEIPEGVMNIKKSAFEKCHKLKTLLLPKSIKSIDTNAFDYSGIEKLLYKGTKDDFYHIIFHQDGIKCNSQYVRHKCTLVCSDGTQFLIGR